MFTISSCEAAGRGAWPRMSASWYGLGMLFVIALFNYIDRALISILQEPLRDELSLSDTQLGALTGLSFALLYATLGLPIARLADRMNRKLVICTALAIWSAATGACGLAANFAQLVVYRMGVAFGEAGCAPASHSMLADYFPARQRGTALALWSLASPVGTMLGFAAGGLIAAALSWRETFLVFGVLGIVLAPIAMTMREPIRGRFDPDSDDRQKQPDLPLRVAFATLWGLKSFRYLAAGGAAHAFVAHVMHNWNAPFYARLHDMPITHVATYLALSFGILGGAGTFFGGFLADRLGRRDRRWYMWLPAGASLLIVPAGLAQYFAPTAATSMAIGLIPTLLLNIWFAPIIATAQALVSSRMRAFTSAMVICLTTTVGLALGPVTTGAISDWLTPTYGENGLRYAMAMVLVLGLVASFLFFQSARHLRTEMPDPA